jgi:predicted Zn-dependent peptidase
VSGAHVTTLPNGLRVVSQSMAGLESAALGLWVEAGARSEGKREHGIAHLLEHMAFKGTRRRSARAIAEEIEAVGGDLNAATSLENTSYYARVLKDDVPLALDIISDILLDSVFDEEELKREQGVVVQEISAALDTPDDLVFDLAQEAAYPGQTIGRSILGTARSVRRFAPADLNGFLERNYVAPRMILSAAGAVDHDQLVSLAGQLFGGLKQGQAGLVERARFKGGAQRLARPIEQTHIVLAFEGRSATHEERYAAQLLATILGGGMSSRLFQEAREKRGLCYGIYAYHWSVSDTGLFGINAATGGEEIEALMEAIGGELEALTREVREDELKRAKAQLRASLLISLERPAARSEQAARQLAVYGRLLEPAEIVARIDAVTTEEVRDVARAVFASPAALASVGPGGGLEKGEKAASHFFSGL